MGLKETPKVDAIMHWSFRMDIEPYAIRCAQGNNGGEWSAHYTEEQKEFWRIFVRDLIGDLAKGTMLSTLKE